MNLPPWTLQLSASVALGLAAAAAVVAMRAGAARLPHHPAWQARLRDQGAALAFVRARWGASTFLFTRLGAALSLSIAALVLGLPLLWALGMLAWWLPARSLQSRVNARRQLIENQLPAFLRCLANALNASPSLAEALHATTGLLPGPLAEEVRLTLRTHALGTPLSESLLALSERVQSPIVNGAVLAMRLSERSGGDLATTLRDTAAALQEMVRLQGVVRTRTAEGKGQAALIGLMPLPLVGFIHVIDPSYFEPLRTLPDGQLIACVAGGLWLTAALSAQRILSVDI